MIELSPNTGFMLYLGVTLIFILGIWGYHHYKNRKKNVLTISQELLVCEYCHFVYLADLGLKVNKCPQCHSFNKSNTYTKK